MSFHYTMLSVVTMAAVMLAFTFLHLPGNTLFWHSLQNSGHTIVFAGLAFFGLYNLVRLHQHSLFMGALQVGLGLSIIGLTIELAQHMTGRGASVQDLAFNGAGIISGTCFYAIGFNAKQRNFSLRTTLPLAIVATVSIMWGLKWPVTYFITELQRPPLPVLANFENLGALYYVGGEGSTAKLATHSEWNQNQSQSVKAVFLSGRWPNITFKEPPQDWSAFSSISFMVFNPSPKPVSIRVRIDDRALGPLNDDHMTVKHLVPEGASMVSLDLKLFKEDALRRARPGRATFEEIAQFMVFVPLVDIPTTLFFDEFLLH